MIFYTSLMESKGKYVTLGDYEYAYDRGLDLYLTSEIDSSLEMLYNLYRDNLNERDEIIVSTFIDGKFKMNAYTITRNGWHYNRE